MPSPLTKNITMKTPEELEIEVRNWHALEMGYADFYQIQMTDREDSDEEERECLIRTERSVKILNHFLDVGNSFYVGFDGETEIVSSNCNPLTKENAPRIKGYEIESENEGVITYKPTKKS